MILGLDISTSCTGWSIISPLTGELISQNYIHLSKLKDTFKKAELVMHNLKKINEKYDITNVFVEENLQMFRPGLSSAKTLITLARFNGMVSLLSYQVFDIEPQFLNVNFARKSVGLKIDKKDKTRTTKEKVLSWVSNEVTFEWPTKILKSGPRKGLQVYEPGCYDIADAYVIALAGYKNSK
jgi:Holliday junction resolvasome RuvABC endonuclease subunit